MMANETLRSIYSAADETVADLDRLLAKSQTIRDQHRGRLDLLVAGLNGFPSSDEEDPAVQPERRGRAASDRGPEPPDPRPFVALPQRTTHGGPWGPVLREKLTNAALAKRGW